MDEQRRRDRRACRAGVAPGGAAEEHASAAEQRGRPPAAWGVLAVAGILASCLPAPLAPHPGLAQWEEPGVLAVREGLVNLAGGNLLIRRTDLTIETRLGTQAVTHAYNSATDAWSWSFEMRYADGLFVDEDGTRHAIAGLPPGPIPGTRWRKVDAAAVETRGGLRFAFAADGSLARVAWRNASFPSLELRRPGDGALRILQCTAADACSEVFTVSYQGAHVVAIADRAGRRCDYLHSSQGRLVLATCSFDRDNGLPGWRYSYQVQDGRPTRISVRNPEREQVDYELDAAQRVVRLRQVGEEEPTWRFEHLASPPRTVVTDPLGRATELRWDQTRRLVEVHALVLGERTTHEWSGRRITRSVGPDGLAATARYGPEDEPIELGLPSGRRLLFDWVPGAVNHRAPVAALPARVRDGLGVLVERRFDAAGRPVAEVDGSGDETRLHYGPLETLARVELPNGLALHFSEYGEHGQPLEVRLTAATPDQPAFVERREFDAVGDMTRGADPGSESGSQHPGVVARRFDAARRLRALVMSQSVDGSPQDVVLERRSDGRLRAIRRPHGSDAEFEYDALGRLREQRERVDGAWAVTRFAYTPLGERARVERPNGMAEELAWDAGGRLVRRSNLRDGALESEVRYGYAAGRLVRKEDSTAPGPMLLGYDARGRVDSVRWPDGEQSRFDYDARDQLASALLLQPDGALLRQLRLGYDGAGRESRLLDGEALLVEQVHAGGRLVAIRTGNGVTRTLSYDEFGRATGAVARDASGRELEVETVLRQHRSLRGPDPNGSIRETIAEYRAETAFGTVSTFEAANGFRVGDGQRWLAGWFADTDTALWRDRPEQTLGDAMGLLQSGLMDLERLLLPDGDGATQQERVFVRNAERNRLERVVHRTIREAPRPCSPCPQTVHEVVEHEYGWDEAGFATRRDGVPIEWDATGHLRRFGPATFEHDGEGRLRAAQVAGVTTRRLFGGLVETDGGGRPLRIDLGAVEIDLAAGTRRYRHFDWRGNVKSVWDEAGTVRTVHEYGPYGLVRSHGEGADRRQFAQGLGIGELVVLGDRVYDPAAMQFLSPDPVYDIVHQYVYGAGDPVRYWDWTGRTARESPGYRIAGSFGDLFGAGVAVAVGLALGAPTGLGAIGIAMILAGPSASFFRVLFEEGYVVVYEWATRPRPLPWTPQLSHEWHNPGHLVPLEAPRPPTVICHGGECVTRFGPGPGRSGGRHSSPPRFGDFHFAPPAPCGLLGVEALPLGLLLARRQRGPARRARHGARPTEEAA